MASLVDPVSFMASERDHVSEDKVEETQLNNSFTHAHGGGGGEHEHIQTQKNNQVPLRN